MTPRFTLVNFKCQPREAITKQQNDAVMNQNRTPKKVGECLAFLLSYHILFQPLIGGDDHDVGNYGTFVDFKQRHNKVYADDAGISIFHQVLMPLMI
jgi:hypothetical protein